MSVEPVIRCVTGNHRSVRVGEHCMLGRIPESIGLRLLEIAGCVMQVRKMSDFHVAS